jgi:hypothetical protein
MPGNDAVWLGFVKITHSLSKVTHRLAWCGMRGETPEKSPPSERSGHLKNIQHSTSNAQRRGKRRLTTKLTKGTKKRGI